MAGVLLWPLLFVFPLGVCFYYFLLAGARTFEIGPDDEPNLAALREAVREHSDVFMVKADLEDADEREATPGMREQP